jgi:hypothetical protein
MAEETDQKIEVPGLDLVPAYSNYFSIVVAPDVTRIVFAEAFGDTSNANYHTSVVLTTNNAKDLAEVILRLIGQNQAEQSTAGGEISEGRGGA